MGIYWKVFYHGKFWPFSILNQNVFRWKLEWKSDSSFCCCMSILVFWNFIRYRGLRHVLGVLFTCYLYYYVTPFCFSLISFFWIFHFLVKVQRYDMWKSFDSKTVMLGLIGPLFVSRKWRRLWSARNAPPVATLASWTWNRSSRRTFSRTRRPRSASTARRAAKSRARERTRKGGKDEEENGGKNGKANGSGATPNSPTAEAEDNGFDVPPPTDEHGDWDDDWGEDDSAEARKERQKDLTNGIKHLTLDDDQEKPEDERLDLLLRIRQGNCSKHH